MKKTLLWLVAMTCFATTDFDLNAQTDLQNSPYGNTIKAYLEAEKDKHDIVSNDFNSLIITNEFYSEASDLRYIYLNQAYQGIKIHNAISTIALRDGKVFHYSHRFIKNINQKINTTASSYTAENAIHKVAQHYNMGTIENMEMIEDEPFVKWFSDGNISARDIKVEKMYYQEVDAIKLVWDVTIYTKDRQHWWNVKVDAVTNEVLNSDDYILSCSFEKDHHHGNEGNHKYAESFFPSVLVDGSNYNVFALPTESPNHGPRQIVSEPASTFASPFGWHDDNGIAGAEYFITRGNNVLAQEDRNGNDGNGFSPNGTPSLNFDFTLDFNQPPVGYENAAITNLFYTNNMMHDIWYHHGFDERSGNFQANNYGNGGIDDDYVLADAQDGSGLNNATFGTPPDGFNPVMTMFLWSASGPPGEPITINNGSLAGNYSAVQAGFGDPLSTTPITADLALAIDNNAGTSADPFDACDAIVNGANLDGKIVVLRRGSCEFGVKVFSAEQEGAIAVIVVNNVPDAPIVMGAGAAGGLVTIPSMMVNQADGEAIISALVNGETINATLVNNGPFQVDGDFDNGIIAHEYGHGISTRLTGGAANSGCLFNAEQMGEGWSDWFGLMVTMKSTDLPEDARGIGTFAIGQDINGQGIRPSRYSPEFTENGFTYADTNNEAVLSVPHGVGFVWATVLWDLTWAYVEKYGFDDDLFLGDGGNNRVMRLVIEGLKLQPCNPGFVDGRDALLAADMAITGGADQCMIWEIFTARGLGINASQGDTASRTDQIESFTMPPATDPSLANCTSLSVDDFDNGNVSVYPNPSNDRVFITTTQSFGDVKLSVIDLNGRVVIERNGQLNGQLELSIGDLQSGIYILSIQGDTIDYNQKLIKN